MNYFAENSNLMVNIVKHNLRSVGEYKVFSATPDTKSPQGIFWRNESKSNMPYDMYRDEELRSVLTDIRNKDSEFFEFVMEKLDLSTFIFDEETRRREAVANHISKPQKFAIHEYTDDRGFHYTDEPIAFSVVNTTGDNRADQTAAIKAALNIEMGVGFYKAIPITDQEIVNKLNELDAKKNTWMDGLTVDF